MQNDINMTKKQMGLLLGKDFTSILKRAETEIIKRAKQLTDKKLSSIKVTSSGISLDAKDAFVHLQGKWGTSGALNYTIRWALKISPGKIKFLEDVGNIPS